MSARITRQRHDIVVWPVGHMSVRSTGKKNAFTGGTFCISTSAFSNHQCEKANIYGGSFLKKAAKVNDFHWRFS